jgi:ankyrin repeat protein
MPRMSSFKKIAATPAILGRQLVAEAGKDFSVGGFSTQKLESLMRRGADVNTQDGDGNTTLLLVVGVGAQIDSHYTKLITQLLNHGADPHLENKKGMSAYKLAKAWGDLASQGQFDRHAAKTSGNTVEVKTKKTDLPSCPPRLKLKK